MGKLTRSGVLRDEARLRRVPRGEKGAKKKFPVMWDGDGARQNHARRERRPHHSDPPHHIVIPVCGD